MRKIILIFILCVGMLSAAATSSLQVYMSSNDSSVKLKWIPKEYSSKNSYKVYRDGKLIASISPTDYQLLKKKGYSKDYLYLVYPFRDVKNIDDQIRAYKSEKKAGGFRILKLMQDNKFSKYLGQYYVDTKVKKGKTYKYRVELYKNNKKITQSSVSSAKKIDNSIFLLQARSGMNGVSLNWDSGNSYAYYNIYRKLKTEKKFKKITKKPIYISPSFTKKLWSFYTDKNLKKGQSAIYYIKKIDMFAQEGKASYAVNGKRTINKTPPIVKNIFVKNRDNKITLRWKKTPKIVGYNVYRSVNYNGGYKKINKKPIKTEAYFDKDFKSNHNYYYYVTSVNKYAESYASTKMLAYAKDVTPPKFPKNLTFSVSSGKVNLKWKRVNDNDLLGYRVYMSMDKNTSEWSMITKNTITTSTFIHKRSKKLSRHFYFYHIRAVDKSFNESAMSNIVKVKLPDVTPPKQPIVHKFMNYPTKIILEWGNIIIYDFDYYNVYRKNGKRLNIKPLIRNSFVDKKPIDGLNEYIITAVDKSGNESLKIKSVKVNLQDTNPVLIKKFKLTRIKNSIKISFVCNDKDYNGFEVYRSSGNDTKYYNISGFQKGNNFIDNSIIKKRVYFYIIKAYDKVGNVVESKILNIKID